jgi:hypothetical protein
MRRKTGKILYEGRNRKSGVKAVCSICSTIQIIESTLIDKDIQYLVGWWGMHRVHTGVEEK